MKTTVKMLAVLLLASLFASSCATMSRLSAEYEEETARVERMSPEEKAEFDKAQHEREKINWNEYGG